MRSPKSAGQDFRWVLPVRRRLVEVAAIKECATRGGLSSFCRDSGAGKRRLGEAWPQIGVSDRRWRNHDQELRPSVVVGKEQVAAEWRVPTNHPRLEERWI